MAEKVKTPHEFALHRAQSQPQLLPPSSFEVTKKTRGDPWQSLAKATNEILQLKLENEKLKVEKQQSLPATVIPVPEHLKAQVSVQHTNEPVSILRDPSRHLDELIARQSSEISDLRSTLHQVKLDHQRELEQQEAASVRAARAVEVRYRDNLEDYERQLTEMSSEMESALSKERKQTFDLQQELEKWRSEAIELRQEVTSTRSRCEDVVSQLTTDLDSKIREADHYRKETSQLKAYLRETQEFSQSASAWKDEKQSLTQKIKELECDCDNLKSTIDLVNVRLTAVNEILAIQENELSTTKFGDNKKKETNLLNRWREKVFTLMVQQKSAEICTHKDDQNWKQKVDQLQSEIDSLTNQTKVLNHSLQDRGAQLQLQMNNNKSLEHELTKVQQVALSLNSRLEQSEATEQQLASLVQRISDEFEEKDLQLKQSLAKLTRFEQRIAFASGRIQMLQGLLARHEAFEEISRDEPVRDVGPAQNTEAAPDDYEHIVRELETVTKERNQLAQRIQHDAQLVESRISHVRSQVEGQIQSLQNAVSHAESQLRDKCTDLHELDERYQAILGELQEANGSIDQLKTELGRQQVQAERALKDRCDEIEGGFSHQLSALESKLSEARREQTKAVVNLRQMERRAAHDKERNAEHLKSVEDYYKDLVSRQEKLLKNMEAEKNLMLSTIRQEGLLNKLKSCRPAPVVDETGDNSQLLRPPVRQSDTQQEPVENILQDLEQLTSQLETD